MKLSLVVRKYNTANGRTFVGCSTEGKYTVPPHNPNDGVEYISPVKNLFQEDFETHFIVKFTKECPTPLPANDGIYLVTLDDEARLWVDLREETTRKTIWIKTDKPVKFQKRADIRKKTKLEEVNHCKASDFPSDYVAEDEKQPF